MYILLALLGICFTAMLSDGFHKAVYYRNHGAALGYAIFTVLSAAVTLLFMFV